MNHDSEILRYDNLSSVMTPLDPLEDIIAWICGLSSIGYTSDILKTVHGMTDSGEIKRCAQAISLYVENSVGLIEQAYSGPPEVSFLPLYYAALNTSKIYIVLSGRRTDLEKHRYHGASYDVMGKSSRDLLTEEIELKRYGILPLFYEVLTGVQWCWQGTKLRLRQVYPCIRGIGQEYWYAYQKRCAFQGISVHVKGNPSDGYCLVAQLIRERSGLEPPEAGRKRYMKILDGFHPDPKRNDVFTSDRVFATTKDEARDSLLRGFRRYLLYEPIKDLGHNVTGSLTVLSGRQLLLPEEIPIWMALFHLSNIVRYKPEFLSKVKDSKSWPMLLALGKHTMLRWLLLFWSYLHQTTYIISVE
jgi:hypothetical protein